jgi:hypothetical protein
VERLIADQSDYHRANALAKEVALSAGRRDPAGVLELGWRTYKDYWNRDLMRTLILVDQGQKEIDKPLIDYFQTRYSEDISQRHLTDSPIKKWHGSATEWYRSLLLSPLLAAAIILLVPQHRRVAIFIGMLVTGLVGANCLLASEPLIRYLHSVEWFTTMLCGVAVASLHHRATTALHCARQTNVERLHRILQRRTMN